MKRIVLAGGGTGGHTFPLIAVTRKIQELSQRQSQTVDIVFLGPTKEIRQYLKKEGIAIRHVAAGKIRRYFSLRNVVDLAKMFIGLCQAFVLLWWYMPDVIFSKGGYGSFPIVIVGWLYRIPIILHESDSVVGATNRLLARFAHKILVSFPTNYPELPSHKVLIIGNPVRDLQNGDAAMARQILQINSSKAIIMILGGSQGALQLNALTLAMLPELTQKYEVIHQTGTAHFAALKAHIQKILSPAELASYHPTPFFEEEHLRHIYAGSSLIVSRAGAGAIFEIALVGKPSILIPLEGSASDHQQQNAFLYDQAGAGKALSGINVTEHLLLQEIETLMEDQKQLRVMAQAAQAFARPAAAYDAAKFIMEYVL